jgi:hypothetical protein
VRKSALLESRQASAQQGGGKWRNHTTVESVCAASSFLAGQLRRLTGALVLFMDQVTITCPNCNSAMPLATEIPADAVCSRSGKPLTRRKSHVEDPEID